MHSERSVPSDEPPGRPGILRAAQRVPRSAPAVQLLYRGANARPARIGPGAAAFRQGRHNVVGRQQQSGEGPAPSAAGPA